MIDCAKAFAGPWRELNPPLSPWVMDVVRALGFTQMTPVQASTIPLFMKHKDVVVEAVTGSGKTLAFVIPTIEKLAHRETPLRKNEIGALIISPTRELATQIHSVFSTFISSASSTPGPAFPPPLLLVSGTDSTPAQDISRFLENGSDIVIGTPGRVEEFLLGKGAGVVSVKELEVLVFDEADRLLDLGFTKAITRILDQLPKQRRTGLFSATMTDALSEIVRVGLRNPVRVVVKVQSKKLAGVKRKAEEIEERRTPASLQIFFLSCKASEKTLQVLRILEQERSVNSSAKFILYFATCATVDYFFRVFSSLSALSPFERSGVNWVLHSLHGHVPPAKRTSTLAAFAAHPSTPLNPSILLCTDVAARGLDVPEVDVVVQYDPPTDTKSFSHRAGRTARMGRGGRAWVLLVGSEREYVGLLSVRKIPIKEKAYLPEPLALPEGEEDPDVRPLLEEMRSIVLKDRDLHDKATKAFVSFVRAYSKHEASYVFRIKNLDLLGVAKAYGLLKLPKMPELKGKPEGWTDAEVDWKGYAYVDKTREKKRLEELSSRNMANADVKRKANSTRRLGQKKKNSAWSEKVIAKEERDKRREKKVKKRVWLNTNTGKSTQSVELDEEWEELAKEERLAKKRKKGLVSSEDDDGFADL